MQTFIRPSGMPTPAATAAWPARLTSLCAALVGRRRASRAIATLASTSAVILQSTALAAPPAPEPNSPSPRVVLAPGLTAVPDHRGVVRRIEPATTPPGFRALFNGVDLRGWHLSRTSNHGSTPLLLVRDGMIIATQDPPGRGGLLVSDESFGDVELYLEARSDWGNDSGVLVRSTEAGAGYQITLDTLPCGSVGRLEGVGGVRMADQTATLGATAPCWHDDPGLAAWKRDDWNVIRIRIEGAAPRVSVSINGTLLPAAGDDVNRAVGGATRGPIALQIHGGTSRWQPGGFWRWRSIAVRELATGAPTGSPPTDHSSDGRP